MLWAEIVYSVFLKDFSFPSQFAGNQSYFLSLGCVPLQRLRPCAQDSCLISLPMFRDTVHDPRSWGHFVTRSESEPRATCSACSAGRTCPDTLVLLLRPCQLCRRVPAAAVALLSATRLAPCRLSPGSCGHLAGVPGGGLSTPLACL